MKVCHLPKVCTPSLLSCTKVVYRSRILRPVWSRQPFQAILNFCSSLEVSNRRVISAAKSTCRSRLCVYDTSLFTKTASSSPARQQSTAMHIIMIGGWLVNDWWMMDDLMDDDDAHPFLCFRECRRVLPPKSYINVEFILEIFGMLDILRRLSQTFSTILSALLAIPGSRGLQSFSAKHTLPVL